MRHPLILFVQQFQILVALFLYLVVLYNEECGGRKLQVVLLHELRGRSGTQIISVRLKSRTGKNRNWVTTDRQWLDNLRDGEGVTNC